MTLFRVVSGRHLLLEEAVVVLDLDMAMGRDVIMQVSGTAFPGAVDNDEGTRLHNHSEQKYLRL